MIAPSYQPLKSDAAALIADGTTVWYAYDPAPSAMRYEWSGEEDRLGAVRRYVIGQTIERDALAISCRNLGASRFYLREADAVHHLVSSRGFAYGGASEPVIDASEAVPQLALF